MDGSGSLSSVDALYIALPNELLEEIFMYCLPEPDLGNFGLELPAELKANDAPLVLCAVCRRWRDIALTTPVLWGSLSFRQSSALSDAGADYVEFWRRWLSRAGTTPVSINIQARWAEDDRVVSMLELVGGLAQQWRDAWLTLGDGLPQYLRLPEAGRFPFLEQLALSESFNDLSISFCDAPKLRDVYMQEFTPQIRLPWHQLTSYKTDTISIPHFLQILGDPLNLVDGRLEIPGTLFPQLPSIVIPLMHLQLLKLGNSYGEPLLMTILDCLRAPALKHLSLSFLDQQESPADVSPFLSFVSRSSFRLHTLELSLMPATTNSLIKCLKATPTVVDLKVRPSRNLDINAVLAQFAA